MTLGSCKKGWLDEKSNKGIVVPTTLKDMQALLDYNVVMNNGSSLFDVPSFAETGTDNYFLQTPVWQALSGALLYQKNAYIFAKDIFEGTLEVPSWNIPYQRVFYTNVALEGLAKIAPAPAEQADWNNARGCALYIRSNAFFWLAQVYSKPYNATTAGSDPGIPLRSVADINAPSTRASVQETYDQIIADTKEAARLLPAGSPYKIRATKPACYGLLARVYLAMGNYTQAGLYADSCLQLYNVLLDFNTINAAVLYPVTQYNAEIIYPDATSVSLFIPSRAMADTVLYKMYGTNDLRKTVFFKPVGSTGYYSFNGSYDGTAAIFSGVTAAEMYITRAECYARANNQTAALADLNTLLIKRWKTGTFVPVTALSAEDALYKILAERRKELCFRGLRWMDLRRLNTDSRFAVTITRMINNITYTLPPGDIKYTYPIPDYIIQYTGMQQNPR